MQELAAFVHGRFGIASLAYAVALGLWGGYTFLRRREVSGSFRSAYLILILLIAVQGLLGVTLFLSGQRPHEILHVVYGIFAIVFLPGILLYSSGDDRLREAAFLVGSCWVVAIALGRGIFTGLG